MIRSLIILVGILVSLIVGGFSPAYAMDAGERPESYTSGYVSIGGEFTSGTYNTDTRTRSLYMPLIVTWLPTERLDLGIELPYLYQSSSAVTTTIYRDTQATATAVTASRGGPGGNGGNGGSASDSSETAVSGIGDIILRLGYIVLFEGELLPQVRPSFTVKFPTARVSDGLGTGEFDFTAGLDTSKWLDRFQLIGELAYTTQGRVEGYGLRDYFSFTAGAGWQMTESVKPMLLVKGAQAPSDYSGNLLEGRARVEWAVTGTTTLDAFISLGISDSSPDIGGGVAVVFSF